MNNIDLSELVRSASIDTLTGLNNRWGCSIAIDEALRANTKGAAMLVDYKKFKEANTKFGNEVGDKLLISIGKTLKEIFPKAMIGRLGGNEFLIWEAEKVVDRGMFSAFVQEMFSKLCSISLDEMEDHRHSFALSAIIIDPEDIHSFEDLYKVLDNLIAQAKNFEGSYMMTRAGGIPDIKGVFVSLRNDRNKYNSISDQLFRITDNEAWFEYIHKSASLKEDMCQRNQAHLNQLMQYYRREDIPFEDYELLYKQIQIFHTSLDPFLIEELLGNILIPYYENLKAEDDYIKIYLLRLYLFYGDALHAIVLMGDKECRKRFDILFEKARKIGYSLGPQHPGIEYYIYMLCHIVGHYDDYDDGQWQMRDELFKELCGYHNIPFRDQELADEYRYLTMNARIYPAVRAMQLMTKKSMTPIEQQELGQKIQYISQHIKEGYLDTCPPVPVVQMLSRLQLQHILHMNDPKVQYEIDFKTFLGFVERMPDVVHGEHITLFSYLLHLLLDSQAACKLSPEVCRKNTLYCWDATISMFKHRKTESMDQQSGMLSRFIGSHVLPLPYLTEQDKVDCLTRSIQVLTLDTYGHCKALAAYARIITENIIDRHPHLLVGALEYLNSIEDVKAHKEDIMAFMDKASIFHDLGKLLQVPVVSNSYRHLTNHERDILRLHPDIGTEILELAHLEQALYDVIKGHHKWYDGSNGYPEGFDNTQSKARILVDIISICDSIEAATSRIGRNYRKAKPFCKLLEELLMQSGTRYNPDVIMSIVTSIDITKKIRDCIETDWEAFYRGIYSLNQL